MRSGQLVPDADALKLMLRAADVLADLVRAARDGAVDDHRPLRRDRGASSARLIGRRRRRQPTTTELAGARLPARSLIAFDEPALPAARRRPTPSASRPHARALRQGQRAAGAAPRARAARHARPSHATSSDLPAPRRPRARRQPISPGPSASKPTATKARSARVFEFVDDDCELVDRRQRAGSRQPPAADGDGHRRHPAQGARRSARPSPPSQAAAGRAGRADGRRRRQPRRQAPRAQPTIRVDLERVDRLIDLVGELVINQAMLSQRVLQASHARASRGRRRPRRTRAADPRDPGQRHGDPRPAGEVGVPAHAAPRPRGGRRRPARRCACVTEGEATEVDKTVIERLADPLTHMIRNAIDHGLEGPDKRIAAGKPAEGTVRARRRCIAPAASSSRSPTTAPASTARACARSPSTRA